ncbi:hypothetical protein D041_3858 [Vibrio parahaemolyticus EKP-008]|nr:hypothetical protein D041_3858 [Vibrio parahaemolyticus EKP-008]
MTLSRVVSAACADVAIMAVEAATTEARIVSLFAICILPV